MRLIDFSKGEKYMVYSAGMVAASSTIRPSSKTKIFSLEKAIEILAEIIKGLELLHQSGYIHRTSSLRTS